MHQKWAMLFEHVRNILEEVQKITEPIKKDIRDLMTENLKLRGDAQKSEEEIKLLKLKVDVLEENTSSQRKITDNNLKYLIN